MLDGLYVDVSTSFVHGGWPGTRIVLRTSAPLEPMMMPRPPVGSGNSGLNTRVTPSPMRNAPAPMLISASLPVPKR
jgi:hypothetical protein